MSRCVLEDAFNCNKQFQHLLPSSTSVDPQLTIPSFEVEDLTWENGHLSEHGPVNPTALYPTNVAGTLECIVDQAKLLHNQLQVTGSCNNMERRYKITRKEGLEDDNTMTTTVGSRGNDTTCNIDDFSFTPSNSIGWSPETKNTRLSGGGGSRHLMMVDDHDSIYRGIRCESQREICGEEDRKVTEGVVVGSNASNKRSRATAIHNEEGLQAACKGRCGLHNWLH